MHREESVLWWLQVDQPTHSHSPKTCNKVLSTSQYSTISRCISRIRATIRTNKRTCTSSSDRRIINCNKTTNNSCINNSTWHSHTSKLHLKILPCRPMLSHSMSSSLQASRGLNLAWSSTRLPRGLTKLTAAISHTLRPTRMSSNTLWSNSKARLTRNSYQVTSKRQPTKSRQRSWQPLNKRLKPSKSLNLKVLHSKKVVPRQLCQIKDRVEVFSFLLCHLSNQVTMEAH